MGYWTPEKEQKLRELWERDCTGTEIAEALGSIPARGKRPARPVSRNMVLGKARRMRLKPRPSPIRPA